MVICGECSTRNNDGESFCVNCGAYLMWQGDQGQQPKRTAEPQREQGEGKTILLPKVPPSPDHAPKPPPGFRRDPVRGSVSQPGRNTEQPPRPRATPISETHDEEESPEVITAERQPVSVADDATRLPEVKPARRTTLPPAGPPALPATNEPPPAPGDLICGQCGTANNPDRHYCRRCAASLLAAAVVPPLPWWRRRPSRRPKVPLPAGTRPKRKRRRFPVRLVSLLAVIGLLGGAAYAGREAITAGLAQVQDKFFSADVRAKSITASSSQPDRPADFAIDTFSNRSWAAGVAGNTSDQFLDILFERPFRLAQIFVSGGASDDANVFIKERRPRNVEVTAVQTDGQRITKGFELKDVKERQTFYMGVDQVSEVQLKILDSTGPDEAPVAIAEVQFSGR